MQRRWQPAAWIVTALLVSCAPGPGPAAPPPAAGAPQADQPAVQPEPVPHADLLALPEGLAAAAEGLFRDHGWQPSGPAEIILVELPGRLEDDPHDRNDWADILAASRAAGLDFSHLVGTAAWLARVPLQQDTRLPAYLHPPELTGHVLADHRAQMAGAWVDVATARPMRYSGEGDVHWPFTLDARTAAEIGMAPTAFREAEAGAWELGPMFTSRGPTAHWFPDGERILVWGQMMTGWYEFVRLDPRTGRLALLLRWDSRDAEPEPVDWLAGGRLLVLIPGRSLELWALDPDSGVAERLARVEQGGFVANRCLAPDHSLLGLHLDHRLLAVDLPSGQVRVLHPELPGWDGLYMVRFSPDCRWVAVPEVDGAGLVLVETATGRRVEALPAGAGYAVFDLAWSPDGRHLAYKPTDHARVEEVADEISHMLTPEIAVVDTGGREVTRWTFPDALVSEMAWRGPGQLALGLVPPGQQPPRREPADFRLADLQGGDMAPLPADEFEALHRARWHRDFPMPVGQGQRWQIDWRGEQLRPYWYANYLVLRPGPGG